MKWSRLAPNLLQGSFPQVLFPTFLRQRLPCFGSPKILWTTQPSLVDAGVFHENISFFLFQNRQFSWRSISRFNKKCRALITPSRTLCFNFSCCRRWIGVPVGSSLTFVITPINQKLGSLKFVNVWTRQRRKEILKKNFRSVLLQGLPHLRFWFRLNSS